MSAVARRGERVSDDINKRRRREDISVGHGLLRECARTWRRLARCKYLYNININI